MKNAPSSMDFARAWLLYNRDARPGSVDWTESEWVCGADVEWVEKRPSDLISAIVEISLAIDSAWHAELLGAGVIETLLARNYLQVVDRIFFEAANSPMLGEALSYVCVPIEFLRDFAARKSGLQAS